MWLHVLSFKLRHWWANSSRIEGSRKSNSQLSKKQVYWDNWKKCSRTTWSKSYFLQCLKTEKDISVHLWHKRISECHYFLPCHCISSKIIQQWLLTTYLSHFCQQLPSFLQNQTQKWLIYTIPICYFGSIQPKLCNTSPLPFSSFNHLVQSNILPSSTKRWKAFS